VTVTVEFEIFLKELACFTLLVGSDMLVTVTVKFDVSIEAGDGDSKSLSIY